MFLCAITIRNVDGGVRGNRLFWEMESSEGENKIEILVITEDCRLVMMEPWIYSEEG